MDNTTQTPVCPTGQLSSSDSEIKSYQEPKKEELRMLAPATPSFILEYTQDEEMIPETQEEIIESPDIEVIGVYKNEPKKISTITKSKTSTITTTKTFRSLISQYSCDNCGRNNVEEGNCIEFYYSQPNNRVFRTHRKSLFTLSPYGNYDSKSRLYLCLECLDKFELCYEVEIFVRKRKVEDKPDSD